MRHLAILLSCIIAADAVLPTIPPWPTKFSVNITTNHTWRVGHSDKPPFAVSGKVFYNWALQALRVDHGAGNFECRHFYAEPNGCSLIHLPSGTYRLLQDPPPGQPPCCLDPFLAEIHAPPPDWAVEGSPTTGVTTTLPYTGYQGLEYLYPSTGNYTNRTEGDNSGCHTYVARTDGSPLLFSFPANFGFQDWYFLAHTWTVDPASMPDRLFQLPAGCLDKRCPKSSHAGRSQSMAGSRAGWRQG